MSILGGLLTRHRHSRGREAQARGDLAEARVVTALRRSSRPSWIHAVRRAHRSEDHTGIDVVVDTSDGPLLLQVKSSRSGARRWRREHRSDPRLIGIVIVRPEDDLSTIYGHALGALILLRERAEACPAPIHAEERAS